MGIAEEKRGSMNDGMKGEEAVTAESRRGGDTDVQTQMIRP